MRRETSTALTKLERALESPASDTFPPFQKFRRCKVSSFLSQLRRTRHVTRGRYCQPSQGSYLCAACTFGQAISTERLGEYGGCPAVTKPATGVRRVAGKNRIRIIVNNYGASAPALPVMVRYGCPRLQIESWGKEFAWACKWTQLKKLKS
jgi:hypothetical protein